MPSMRVWRVPSTSFASTVGGANTAVSSPRANSSSAWATSTPSISSTEAPLSSHAAVTSAAPCAYGGHQQHAVVRARHERQMRAQQHVRVPAAVVAMDDAFRASGRAGGHDRLAPGARIERRRCDRARAGRATMSSRTITSSPSAATRCSLAALGDGAAHAHDPHRIGDVVGPEIEIDHELGGAARHHAVARRPPRPARCAPGSRPARRASRPPRSPRRAPHQPARRVPRM